MRRHPSDQMPDSPLDLVLKLVALATDPGASEHEARNAAFTACRLIRKHGLLQGSSQYVPPEPEPVPAPPPRPPPAARPEPARHESVRRPGRFMVSKFSGHCKWCHETYAVGDWIYWRGTGMGSDHEACAKERFDVDG
jgi:hypothetical protein